MLDISSSHQAGSVPRESFVAFVRDALGSYPNPDEPQPPGPWDPIIRAALQRVAAAGPVPDPWLEPLGLQPRRLPWHLAFGPGPQPWSAAALINVIARRHPELWDLFGGGPLALVALNPQPLPPRIVFAAALADELIERAAAALDVADWLPQPGEQQGIIIVGGRLLQYVDDFCGNDFKFRIPKPVPPPPGWREELSSADLVAMGVRFENAAAAGGALRDTFAQAGEKLVEAGLSKLQ